MNHPVLKHIILKHMIFIYKNNNFTRGIGVQWKPMEVFYPNWVMNIKSPFPIQTLRDKARLQFRSRLPRFQQAVSSLKRWGHQYCGLLEHDKEHVCHGLSALFSALKQDFVNGCKSKAMNELNIEPSLWGWVFANSDSTCNSKCTCTCFILLSVRRASFHIPWKVNQPVRQML